MTLNLKKKKKEPLKILKSVMIGIATLLILSSVSNAMNKAYFNQISPSYSLYSEKE